MHCSSIDITTGPVYASGASYQMIDFNLATAESNTRHLRADAEGRLNFHVNCEGHQVGFSGPGTGAEAPALLPLTDDQDVPRYLPGRLYSLPIRVVNMRSTPINKLRLELTSAYPTVHIARAKSEIQQIAPGKAADLSSDFQVRFTAGDGGFAHARLTLKMAYDNTHESSEQIDVLVAPDHMSAPLAVKVLDGREGKFPVFLQAREGGGSSIERTVVEGKGNGNGVLEPGERATVWLQHAQGLDPADKNNWCRAKIYFDSSSLKEVSDIEEQKGLEWTSAKNRTSVVELSYKAARREAVPVILDCESWSYHFTPDVRYGKELLYQPFQLHQHHLFSWSLETQSKDPFPATQLPGIVRPSAKGVNRPMPKPRKQSHATAADLPALQAELDDGERKIAAEEKRLKKQRLQAKANGSR